MNDAVVVYPAVALPGDLVRLRLNLALWKEPNYSVIGAIVGRDALLLVVGRIGQLYLVIVPGEKLGWLPLTDHNVDRVVAPVDCTGHTEAPT